MIIYQSSGRRIQCNKVIKSLTEGLKNNRRSFPVQAYSLQSNVKSTPFYIERRRSTTGKDTPFTWNYVSDRHAHSFATHNQEKITSSIGTQHVKRRTYPREILRQGERQYSVRIGNGVQSSALLLDGSEPESITVHLDIMNKDNDDPTIPDIKVSTYNEDKVAPYTSQTERGAVHNMADILNFMFRTDKDTDLKCCLTLYFGNGAYLGRAFLSLDNSAPLEDAKLPIINDTHTIVGILNCSIVEVKGIPSPKDVSPFATSTLYSDNIPATTANHHNHGPCDVTTYHDVTTTSRTLEIGHRGCGVTETDKQLFSELPCLAENTVASLTLGHRHGAHMVETDVVVTQDLKAVLHHDLEIELSGTRKVPLCHVASNVLENIPPLPLTVNKKEIRHQLLLSEHDKVGLESIQSQNKMFPYLSDILTNLPASLGLMLEVKANLPDEKVDVVKYHADRNSYIDVILKEMFIHAGNRDIILCSFCPTTCTLLRNKQDRWPVVIILQGSTDTYPDYMDHRLRSLSTSINFATSEDLHGVSLFSGLLQDNPQGILDDIRDRGMKSFVWGYHNCQQEFRAKMRQCGVDGLIYDRIYEENLPKRLNTASK